MLGFALSGVGIGALVYTTIETPRRGWLAPLTTGGYVLGSVVLAAFAVWEERTPQPMLDIDLFRNIRFSAASFSIMVAFFGLFGFVFLITQYSQLVRGYDTLSAGLHTLPFAIATGAAAPLAPLLAARIGTKIVVPLGLVMMGAGLLIATGFRIDMPYFGPVMGSMVLMAAGLGLVTAPSTDAILAVLPPAKAGVGSAVNDVTRELGGAFGVAVMGAAFSSSTAPRSSSAPQCADPALRPGRGPLVDLRRPPRRPAGTWRRPRCHRGRNPVVVHSRDRNGARPCAPGSCSSARCSRLPCSPVASRPSATTSAGTMRR